MNFDLIRRILQYICIYIAGIIGVWRLLIPDPQQTRSKSSCLKTSLNLCFIFFAFTLASAKTWSGYPELVCFIAFMLYAIPTLCITSYADDLDTQSRTQS